MRDHQVAIQRAAAFAPHVRGDVHEGVHADTLRDERSPRPGPVVLHRDGYSDPKVENDLCRLFNRALLQDGGPVEKAAYRLLQRAQRRLARHAGHLVAAHVQLAAPRGSGIVRQAERDEQLGPVVRQILAEPGIMEIE